MPSGYLREPVLFLVGGMALAIPLLILNIRLAPRLGLIDWPKTRGVTEEQIPIVGHSMVLITLIVLGIYVQNHFVSPWFLLTSIILGVMGHMDDRRPLPAIDKFLFQLACALVVVYLDPTIYKTFVVKYGAWGAAWAAFFLLGIVNAINFVDGIDGLAGLVLMVGAGGLMLLAGFEADTLPLRCVGALVCGMMVPFLYANVMKRRGFLGNVGSYFFSYLLGMLHLSLPPGPGVSGLPNWIAPLPLIALSALCFIIPCADSLQVILGRMITGRSPFQADRGHLHHRLLQTSLPLRWVLFTFSVIDMGGALVAAGIALSGSSARSGLLPLVACLALMSCSAMLILLIERASQRRLRSYFDRLESGEPIYYLKYRLENRDGRPISAAKLRRIEARVAAEIRVTDTCFAEAPDRLFITLKTLPEPMKNIMGRIGMILQSEKLLVDAPLEQGEYIRTLQPVSAAVPVELRALKAT